MARSIPSPLERQLARVSRRLFLQVLLDSLLWCWAVALALGAIWFLVQPRVINPAPEWLRWTVAGGAFGLATLLALGIALLRRPWRLSAALSLDERFALRERVTTSLTLAPQQEGTPAAQALLADVNERISDLDVGSRFPFRVSWNAALVPVGALLVLALVALFYEPAGANSTPPPGAENTDQVPNAEEIEKKIAEAKLERKGREVKPEDAEKKDDDLKKFEEDMDRIFSKPREKKDDLAQRVDEMEDLKKKMQDHKKEVEDKSKALQEQLKQADRLGKKQNKQGPASELEKALNKGDVDKAKEEVDKLAKKLQENKLSKEEQEQLADQLKEMKEKLERLTRQEEEEDLLRELARNGEINEEQLERELEQLKKNSEKLNDEQLKQDLQDIAEQLAECQRCMKDGDSEGAARALKKAGAKISKLDKDGELQQLARQIEQLERVRQSMCKGMGEGGNPVPGAGQRPEEEDKTASQQTRITGDQDPKGRKEIIGTAPGSNFRRPVKQEELAEQIKQARQEAPEALERQRIPRAANDIAKGYFENLGNQKEPEKKGGKP